MTDTVWSVNILLGFGMIGVGLFIWYILKLAYDEENQDS